MKVNSRTCTDIREIRATMQVGIQLDKTRLTREHINSVKTVDMERHILQTEIKSRL